MKKGISVKGGSKTMVILGLLAVLLVSLGYLSMQGGKEGMATNLIPAKQSADLKNKMIPPT
jgi:hypothetical protein